MFNIGARSTADLEALFQGVATEIEKPYDIVEKDFWVCWTLLYLFHDSPWKNNLAFKGGTSLSKGFNLINRFSEDIDVILDWGLLGYTDEQVWANRTRTKDYEHVQVMNEKGANFLGGKFIAQMRTDFSKKLPKGGFELFIDPNDPQTINFKYPKTPSSTAGGVILDVIKLEMGANAAWTPSQSISISPYISEVIGSKMAQSSVIVLTANPKRTFWEKVTILHKVACEPQKAIPNRYARHYYDLYMMDKSNVKTAAYADLPLLARVVEYKRRFYQCAVAIYNSAKPGTMLLVPNEANHLDALKRDYRLTTAMMYGELPTFDDILDCLTRMEKEINAL